MDGFSEVRKFLHASDYTSSDFVPCRDPLSQVVYFRTAPHPGDPPLVYECCLPCWRLSYAKELASSQRKPFIMSDVKIRRSSASNPTSPKRPLYPRFVTKPDLSDPSPSHHGRRRYSCVHCSNGSASVDNPAGGRYCRTDKQHSSCSSPSAKKPWSPRCRITDRLPLAASRLLAEPTEEPACSPIEHHVIQVVRIQQGTIDNSSKRCKSSVKRTCRIILRTCSKLIATQDCEEQEVVGIRQKLQA